MATSNPEHSDFDLVLTVLKYIGAGFISITSMFFLWVIGRYKTEHESMYLVYLDAIGKSAEKLKDKLKEEAKKQNEEFMHLVNRVLQLEENYQGIVNELEEVKKLIVHKDNNYSQSTQVMLKLLMEIQDEQLKNKK